MRLTKAWIECTKLIYQERECCRIDQVIEFEVLKPLQSKQVQISTKTARNGLNQLLKFRFDCFAEKQARWQWIHKEEETFHGVSDTRSYSMPVTPICVGDRAQISLALASLMGSIDLASIEWQPLMVEPLPSQNTIRNYNRSYNITPDRNKFQKYFADLSRVCDLEDTVNEWFDKEYLYEVCPVSLT